MNTTLIGMIAKLVKEQHGIEITDNVELNLDSIQQNIDYPDRHTVEGVAHGTPVTLGWKRVSITPKLDPLSKGFVKRDDAEEEGIYYDTKLMHHYLALKPGYTLSDVNRLLGTDFTEDQLKYKTEGFEGLWEFNHPCIYGRLFTQVLLPKAS